MRWTDTRHIDAPAAVVWQLTTDVEQWPTLFETVQRVERLDDGPLRVGSTARIKQPGQSPAIWTVTELDPSSRFVWQTRRPGLQLVATHEIVDETGPDGGGACRNTLTLDLTGALGGLVARLLTNRLAAVLTIENQGFRTAAERTTAS
jgi:uncharacterized membrane protein